LGSSQGHVQRKGCTCTHPGKTRRKISNNNLTSQLEELEGEEQSQPKASRGRDGTQRKELCTGKKAGRWFLEKSHEPLASLTQEEGNSFISEYRT
jgi:hypothetical protein